MTHWHEDPDELDGSGIFDPLCVERSAPMEDEEAALVEAICHAATPGPLVIDELVEGQGAVVVSLPDGRLIVSLSATVEHAKGEAATRANAELICKARYVLLRLLRDRQQWKEERELLLERIRALETELEVREVAAGQAGRKSAPRASARPR